MSREQEAGEGVVASLPHDEKPLSWPWNDRWFKFIGHRMIRLAPVEPESDARGGES